MTDYERPRRKIGSFNNVSVNKWLRKEISSGGFLKA
jgi:hypothetical protein